MVYRHLDGKKDDVQMRKYQHLLSCVLAFISTALFLFYKHEYDRVRTVLEVLDTFGSGGTQSDCTVVLEESDQLASGGPSPSWQKFGSLLLYSAFYVAAETGTPEVVVLGFLNPDMHPLTECTIWVDYQKDPLEGKLSVEALDVGDKQSNENFPLVAARFSCKPSITPDSVPYAVTLGKHQSAKHQVLTYIHNSNVSPPANGTALCLLPLSGPYQNLQQLAEFLEVYRLQGITDIYIYDQGIDPKVRDLLRFFRHETGVNVYILPWSLGDDFDSEKTLLINDCILRARSSANYAFITSINQMLVPRYHNNIQAVLRDVEEADSNPVAHFVLNNRVFCLEYESDSKALPLKFPLTVLEKTYWSETTSSPSNTLLVKTFAVNSVQNGFQPMFSSQFHTYSVPPEVMLVHSYKKCDTKSPISLSQHDDIMYKYREKFINSDIIKFSKD